MEESETSKLQLSNAPNSQDLPDNYHALTFGINIISKNKMIKYKNIVGKKPKFVILSKPETIDINDQNDFEFAKFVFKKSKKSWKIELFGGFLKHKKLHFDLTVQYLNIIVQILNYENNLENDQFELLRKIHKSPESSQRDLAYDLGFSLGKLNYCLRS